MPRKDIYHDSVKIALEKDGWRIIRENLHIKIDDDELFIDLEAEAVFIAEREGEKIAIEIKSFRGQSFIHNMHEALGQYNIYRVALNMERPELAIYLAVPEKTYQTHFQSRLIKAVIKADKLNIIVYNEDNQSIISWITH
jgi:XisH protein